VRNVFVGEFFDKHIQGISVGLNCFNGIPLYLQ